MGSNPIARSNLLMETKAHENTVLRGRFSFPEQGEFDRFRTGFRGPWLQRGYMNRRSTRIEVAVKTGIQRSAVEFTREAFGMASLQPDIILKAKFLTTAQGGRRTPIWGQQYRCPLQFDDAYHDCAFLLGDSKLELGVEYEVPVKFLVIDLVKPKLALGMALSIWEGKIVGHGVVTSIL